MSIFTDTTITSTEIEILTPRELHHAEDLHEGDTASCGLCDRYELVQYNGYVDGLADWYDHVGQFLESIGGNIGATR